MEAQPPTPSPALKCAKCGSEIRPGKKFCSRCGAPAQGPLPAPPRSEADRMHASLARPAVAAARAGPPVQVSIPTTLQETLRSLASAPSG